MSGCIFLYRDTLRRYCGCHQLTSVPRDTDQALAEHQGERDDDQDSIIVEDDTEDRASEDTQRAESPSAIALELERGEKRTYKKYCKKVNKLIKKGSTNLDEDRIVCKPNVKTKRVAVNEFDFDL